MLHETLEVHMVGVSMKIIIVKNDMRLHKFDLKYGFIILNIL